MKHPGLLYPDKTPRLASLNGFLGYSKPVTVWTEKHHNNRQQLKKVLFVRDVFNGNDKAYDLENALHQTPVKNNQLSSLEQNKRKIMQTLKKTITAIDYVKADIRTQKNRIELLEAVTPGSNFISLKKTQLKAMEASLSNFTELKAHSTHRLTKIQLQLNALWKSMRRIAIH